MTSQPAAPALVHAEAAASAIRALNHATRPGLGWCDDGLTGPADVYDVVGALATLAARLPQALTQLQAWLDTETDAGRVAVVDGEHAGDPAALTATVGYWTDTAASAARALTHALDHAHTTLTWAARTTRS